MTKVVIGAVVVVGAFGLFYLKSRGQNVAIGAQIPVGGAPIPSALMAHDGGKSPSPPNISQLPVSYANLQTTNGKISLTTKGIVSTTVQGNAVGVWRSGQ
jgi:hypothetical protein